jgi:hypothetical protein
MMRAVYVSVFVLFTASLLSAKTPNFLPLPGTPRIIFQKVPGASNQTIPLPSGAAWVLVRPVLVPYDNVKQRPMGYIEPIRYTVEPFHPKDGAPLRAIAAFGPGTFYLAAIPSTASPSGAFRESEPLHRRFEGRVIQVVNRTGDTYLDYLQELRGTPFIMGPGITASGLHQTDQRQGSDCAELAIYGRRRMGQEIPYGGPSGIVKYLVSLHQQPLQPVGPRCIYQDEQQHTIPIGKKGIQPGDIIHFGQQVSVFIKDEGVCGYLDVNDIVFESWGNTPREISIARSDFSRLSIQVYRWRNLRFDDAHCSF